MFTLETYPFLSEPLVHRAAIRVIVDNDFAGDPDDYVQLAHHILNPGAEIVGIIASHLRPLDPFAKTDTTAHEGYHKALTLAETMGLDFDGRLVIGSEVALPDRSTPVASAGVDLILAEARRDDDRPLFVACGGGLTDVASALLTDPGIAEKITVAWIGGPEYPDTTEPVPGNPVEYNLSIDIAAAQAVLDSMVEVWQVPRDVYRQCLISDAELRTRIRPLGALGQFLYHELTQAERWVSDHFGTRRASYVIGDSPLVSLTALQSIFESTPASSRFSARPAVRLGDDGQPISFDGRNIRVFSHVDVRLIVEDLVALLSEFAAWQDRDS